MSGHNLNINYADYIMLTADTERKLPVVLDKAVKANKKKGLNTTCRKTECMVIMNGHYTCRKTEYIVISKIVQNETYNLESSK